MNLEKKMRGNRPEKPNFAPKCRSVWKKVPKGFRKNSLTFEGKCTCVLGKWFLGLLEGGGK